MSSSFKKFKLSPKSTDIVKNRRSMFAVRDQSKTDFGPYGVDFLDDKSPMLSTVENRQNTSIR
jgi:hypothetical protein